MSHWQAIIFDLDDTLYPERDYVLSGFRAVSEWASMHLGIIGEDGYQQLKSLYETGVRGDTFNRWLRHYQLDQTLATELVTVYRQHTPRIQLFPDAESVLSDLHGRYRLALLSDGYLRVQQRKLSALNIRYFFGAVLFTDELGRENWKPSLTPFREILRRLDIGDPQQAIYVGDNPLKDFFGARALGIYTIWCRRPNGEYTNLEPPDRDHAPDTMISCLNDLPQFLEAS